MFCIVISTLIACTTQPTATTPLPTLARFPTQTATSIPPATSLVANTETLSPTATITHTPTDSATASQAPVQPSITLTSTITPTIVPSPTPTATPLPATFIFGQSSQGRDLVAHRLGTGRYIIVLVGGIHAGFEANTITLVEQLQRHFENNPTSIVPEVTLLFVPTLNPDGAARGRILEGRFNGNGVDLNRNWGCGWSSEAVFGGGSVDPGSEPFSEPESIAMGSLIERTQPAAVIFYHSAADGVFAGGCDGETQVSDALAEIYGEAANYSYGTDFDAYPVTGTAPAWVDSVGIPSLDVELSSAIGTDFDRNLTAVMALQEWVTTP